MEAEGGHAPSLAGLAVRIGIGGAAAWFGAGFFFPDPHFVKEEGLIYPAVMWAGRVGIPLLLVAAAGLDHRVRQGRTDRRVVPLLVVGSLVGVLVLLPAAFYLYEQSFERRAGKMHAFLQLDPPLAAPTKGDDRRRMTRVFCLGGSTTEFKDSEGRGWPTRVEARLGDADTARPVEVSNLGRQWYTSHHSLINYTSNLRPLRPDVVVVMHAINDVLNNADFSYFSRGPFREDYGHFYGPILRLASPQSLPGKLVDLLSAVWYHEPREVVDTEHFPGLKAFERNLRTLVELAQLDGTRIALMTQPNLYKPSMTPEERAALYMLNHEAVGPRHRWSFETARAAMCSYNDAVRRVARGEGVALIDLESLIPKTLEHFSDDVHYRAGTFDLVAEHVTAGLESSGVLDPERDGEPGG